MSAKAVMLGPDNDLFRQRVEELNAIAQRTGHAVEFRLVDARQSADLIVENCGDAIALVPGTSGNIHQFSPEAFVDLVRRLPHVKLVQTPSSGTDHLDKSALAAFGVAVANHGGANAPAVAEHTIMMMVAVLRKVPTQLTSVKAGTWSRPLTAFPETEFRTLVGKRVGLVGLGRIGSRVARRLQGWECQVCYSDVIAFSSSYERELGVTRTDFNTLLETCDVVSLHVPLEPDTFHLMSGPQLARMKPTAILINTCRGPVVDEAALMKALEAKTIFGAGLDVLETEPMPADYPLAAMPNVMITPHAATRAVESTDNAKLFMIENIERLSRGEPLQSVVPPAHSP